MSLSDPLAGMRDAINRHELTSLFWPLKVNGEEQRCPVEVGQSFDLRSCSITITRIERTRRHGHRVWRAAFDRVDKQPDRPLFLSRTGDYTRDEKQALKLGEDVIDEEQRSIEHKNAGEPLEPEAVPPHEIKGYRGSRDAHQQFLLEVGADRTAEQEAPLEVRLARLRAASRGRHVDISKELFVIEKRIRDAERKLERRAAA